MKAFSWLHGLLSDERSGNKQSFGKNLADYIVNLFLEHLPPIPLMDEIKSRLMTSRGATIGKRVKLLQGIWVDRFSNLEIGDNVSLARGITLVSAGGITIGDRTMVGHGSKLISAAHSIPKGRKPMRFSELVFKKIIIENDVWIGAQAVILPGVTVGEGAVVGAGAVVTKNVSPFAIVGGVPAKLIRMRD